MKHQNFIDRDKLYGMLDNNAPNESSLLVNNAIPKQILPLIGFKVF